MPLSLVNPDLMAVLVEVQEAPTVRPLTMEDWRADLPVARVASSVRSRPEPEHASLVRGKGARRKLVPDLGADHIEGRRHTSPDYSGACPGTKKSDV